MTSVDTADLERLVDRYPLAHVIELLAYLCYWKAMDIGSNREEKALADEWCKAGCTLEHLMTNRSIRAISNQQPATTTRIFVVGLTAARWGSCASLKRAPPKLGSL